MFMKKVKDIVVYVINPFLLVILIVILSLNFLAVQKDFPSEHLGYIQDSIIGNKERSLHVPMSIDEWSAYYNGGVGVDKVISISEESVRVSTGGDGSWYGAQTHIPSVDLSNKTISFSVRAFDWSELDRLILIFSTDQKFENYFSINLKNYFSKPASNEWISVVLEPSVLLATEGNPDLSNISSMALRVVPLPGVSTRVWFDEFKLSQKFSTKPIVTMAFDDGFASVMDMATEMDKYGYKGSAYIIPEFLNEESYMTSDDVDILANLGWDISGHGKNNLTTLVPADVDTDLAAAYNFLFERKYQGFEHYAYPNGAYNQSTKSQVLEYFKSARTIDGFSQPTEFLYPENVNAVTISSKTPLVEIIETIDQAVEDNTWLILVWHDFNKEPTSDVQYHTDDFIYILGYLQKKEVEVLPYSIVYDTIVEDE